MAPLDPHADPLLADLAAVVGEPHVLVDDAAEPYRVDWTGRFRGARGAVVRPADLRQVVDVVDACRRHGAAIVPQGGNTGLVGGSVPAEDEVVLSLRRLDGLEEVDADGGSVVVGAGATLAQVQAHAAAVGLRLGVDLAARDSATIGGMVATNAGGMQVLRHGPMRAQVLGVEAVLADGSVVRRLPGLAKDNTGYDLPGLLAGSEGTLAIVTRVGLRLVPLADHRVTALLPAATVGEAQRLLARLRPGLPDLEAAEVVHDDAVALVCEHTGAPPPFGDAPTCLLLVEVAANDDPTERLAAAVEAAGAEDAAVATDRPGRERLWAYRERLLEAIAAAGVPTKLDVTLPGAALGGFAAEAPGLVAEAAPGARVLLFGHLGDGNLHVNVLGGEPTAVEDAVLGRVVELGGSVSSEHGVGRAKARWLPRARGDADVAAMRAIKDALDPRGALNPHALLPR